MVSSECERNMGIFEDLSGVIAMNKTITLCIMQSAHTVFSIVLWVALAAIWHKIQYKSLRGFWMNMGVKRPKKGAFLRSAKPVGIAYLFTIAMFYHGI